MSDNGCCSPGVENNDCEADNLLGCACIKTQPTGILAGVYARGDILYKTATVGVLTNKATTPGAVDADAVAIMPFTVTLAADDSMAVFVAGEFNEDLVVGFDSLGDVKQVLREVAILLRKFG